MPSSINCSNWPGDDNDRRSELNSKPGTVRPDVIMVAVFSIFIGMGLVELKMLGVGLAAAILLDATIVRGVLLPAAMALLGNRCWYLPRWLSWLPGRTTPSPDTTKSERPAGAL